MEMGKPARENGVPKIAEEGAWPGLELDQQPRSGCCERGFGWSFLEAGFGHGPMLDVKSGFGIAEGTWKPALWPVLGSGIEVFCVLW